MGLFDNARNPRHQGDIGVAAAIYYFTLNGYSVSVPLTDNQPYDIVVEKDKKFQSVSVKSTKCKDEYEIYQVAIKQSRHNSTKLIVNKFDKTLTDLLFILVETGEVYLIPCSEINNTHTINLGENYKKYKKY